MLNTFRNCSTEKDLIQFWVLEMTSTPKLNSSRVPVLSTLKHCYKKHSYAGLEMNWGWKTINFQRSYCSVSWPLVNATGGCPNRYRDSLKRTHNSCCINTAKVREAAKGLLDKIFKMTTLNKSICSHSSKTKNVNLVLLPAINHILVPSIGKKHLFF